ncbi:hypothetical protein LP414_05750 [Polaromonas sp. P1(28)-13]|nr:hypothetical protein LP414_05750 [Polaromonas sp. P1(28)-13]
MVTWNWLARHEAGQYSPTINVVSVAILGSPLQGSCEIIRMIQSGYVQPSRNDQIKLRTDLKPVKSIIEKLVDALTNALSGELTQGIRPLVLSWPGAIELSPPPSTAFGKTSCVGVPADESQPIGTPGTSYYNPAFWDMVAGKDMLWQGSGDASFEVPASLSAVLSKAAEFRTSFKVEKLKVPVWLYYSQIWWVPSEAGYQAPHIAPADQWTTVWGDGRVPATSAMVVDNPTVFSYQMGLESVHGNLPADPNFFADFFSTRLPDVLNSSLAIGMVKEALGKPDWMAAYAKLSGVGPDSAQLRVSMEPSVLAGNESAAVKELLETSRAFNEQICKRRSDCAQSYAKAKQLVAGISVSNLSKLSQYSSATRAVGQGPPGLRIC